MSFKERCAYDREQREKEADEADKNHEKEMQEVIFSTKARIGCDPKMPMNVVIQRIRGLIHIEGDDKQDYEVCARFGEFVLKPLKNTNNRIAPENLGFMIYGRHVVEG